MSQSYGSRIAIVALVVLLSTLLVPFGPSPGMVMAQAGPAPYVPVGLVEIERGGRTLSEIAGGFPAPAEAMTLLRAWGWSVNAYFNYAGETANGTTSLEISVHLFADDASGTEAMSYFAAGRSLLLGMDPVPIGRIGDQVLAIGGRHHGVNEITIYVRAGAILVRVSAVAPSADPFADADLVASQFLTDVQRGGSSVSARTVDDLLPMLADLPFGFRISDEGSRDQSAIAATFLRPVEADGVLTSFGFQENVYRYFERGSSSFPGAAMSIEISLHLFVTADGAASALPYYANGRAEALGIRLVGSYDIGDGAFVLIGPVPGGGFESTVYMLAGNVLARVSAVSPDGDPTADALAAAFTVASRT
jgi:hypothetical protein